FSWGLVLGLLATVPIFFSQATGLMSWLVDYGLVPGYYAVLHLDYGNGLRFSGLWGHPNEAGHVAALAAPGAAYIYLVYRRLAASVLVAFALLVIFYYTQSRGGLLVGFGVLALPFFYGRGRRLDIVRFVLVAVSVWAFVQLLSQFEFLSERFADAGTSGNFSERLSTVLYGIEEILSHPFGMSLDEFYSLMSAATGGVPSVHNGFLFFGLIFGWLPLAVLITVVLGSLFIRSDADV